MAEKLQVLLVDDEQQMLMAMEAVLARLGHAVIKAGNGQEALEILEKTKIDLVISDMRMPVMTGGELLARIHEMPTRVPVVMITAYGTITQAVEAMRDGAFDFITKPFSAEDLERVVDRACQGGRRATVDRENAKPRPGGMAIVTLDNQFRRVIEVAIGVAPSSASVLVQGESGTGKELLARLIHQSSGRSGPFVAVNCAALPEHLLESELFGHEKGSFTGAVGTKIGRFELANGGTILLDEISEMEPTLQAKLLRVLQEREVDRVGSSKPIPVDVRVVATTNRDIRREVQAGRFREDLYYRLNVIPLMVPPLRERKGDVKVLVDFFVKKFSGENPRRIAPEVLSRLESYQWPGNVRELQNACERAVLLSPDDTLTAESFLLGSLEQIISGGEGDALRLYSGLSVAEAEKRLIIETLRVTNNNKTKAAELLGISIRTLRNKLHDYGMAVAESGEAGRSGDALV